MPDDKLYCTQCHIQVRKVASSKSFIGVTMEDEGYVHITVRTNAGDSYCGRRLLTVDDVEPLIEANEA